MQTVGIFKAKTHLTEYIKDVQNGEELCITIRGKKVAAIIPMSKYLDQNAANAIKRFRALRKLAPIGTPEEVMEWKNEGRK